MKINSNLGDLKWVEGDFPTRFGVIHIKHTLMADGKIHTDVKLPKGVTLLKS